MQRRGICVLFGAALMFQLPGLQAPADQPVPALAPAAAWQRLKDGNARFVADKATGPHRDAKRRAELTKGQNPMAIVLSCSDSRVVPEILFDQGLGDLFDVSVAGNVSSPSIIGSMEYAVGELKTPLIVVLGHSHCGAVKAALAGKALPGDLGKLIKQVHPGAPAATNKAEALAAAARANALFQARRLTEQSPLLRDSVSTDRVRIVTGIYDLESGAVHWLTSKPAK
jgi:carbonic anhydrase